MRAGGEVEVCSARVDSLELLGQWTRVVGVPAGALEVTRESRGDDGSGVGRASDAQMLATGA